MEPQANTVTRPAWGAGDNYLVTCGNPHQKFSSAPGRAAKKERPMSAERQVVQDYIDALVKRADFTRYFTEDVIATFEGPTSVPMAGRLPGS